MNGFFEQYKNGLKEKALADNTVSSYLSDIKLFFDHCDSAGIEYLHQIDAAFLNSYIDTRLLKGNSVSSINRTVAALKSYFRFLKTGGYYFTDPTKNLKTQKVSYKNPDYLSEREINNLCDFGRFFTPLEYRDTLMIYLCTHTGINVTEVCSLTLNDVNLNVGTVKINSQKHKRTVLLDEEAQKRLEHYINTLRPVILNRTEDTDALFPSTDKKAISRQGFWKNLNLRCKRLKIKKRISPNNLKYSYMVRMIEDGNKVETVRENMGYLDRDALRKCSKMLKEKYSKARKKK